MVEMSFRIVARFVDGSNGTAAVTGTTWSRGRGEKASFAELQNYAEILHSSMAPTAPQQSRERRGRDETTKANFVKLQN